MNDKLVTRIHESGRMLGDPYAHLNDRSEFDAVSLNTGDSLPANRDSALAQPDSGFGRGRSPIRHRPQMRPLRANRIDAAATLQALIDGLFLNNLTVAKTNTTATVAIRGTVSNSLRTPTPIHSSLKTALSSAMKAKYAAASRLNASIALSVRVALRMQICFPYLRAQCPQGGGSFKNWSPVGVAP